MCLPETDATSGIKYCTLHTVGGSDAGRRMYNATNDHFGELLGLRVEGFSEWLRTWMEHMSKTDLSVHLRSQHLDAFGAMTFYVEADHPELFLAKFKNIRWYGSVAGKVETVSGNDHIRAEFAVPMLGAVEQTEAKEGNPLDTHFRVRFEVYNPTKIELAPMVLRKVGGEAPLGTIDDLLGSGQKEKGLVFAP